jgi:hypothetical protein
MKKVIFSAVLFLAAVSYGTVANAQCNKKADKKECCQKPGDKAKKDCKMAVAGKDCKGKCAPGCKCKGCAKNGKMAKKGGKPCMCKKACDQAKK